MLVSHRKKFIYTKTIKTGGTSVESYFEKYCMRDGEWTFDHKREEYQSEYGIIGFRGTHEEKLAKQPTFYNHMPAYKIKEIIGSKTWDEYYKFCVVRNPYEKVLSAFFHFFIYNNNIIKSETELIHLFREWIKSGKGTLNDKHMFTIDGKLCMDFFIRHESMLEDIKNVCRILDIEYTPDALPKLKSGYKPEKVSILDYYDAKTARIIEDRYSVEFELFKYKSLF